MIKVEELYNRDGYKMFAVVVRDEFGEATEILHSSDQSWQCIEFMIGATRDWVNA